LFVLTKRKTTKKKSGIVTFIMPLVHVHLNPAKMGTKPSVFAEQKRVSFGDSDTVHLVENYKLAMDTPYEHSRVWYMPDEMEQFARDEKIYRKQQAAAAAYRDECQKQHQQFPLTTSPSKKEMFQQQTKAIRHLRLAASAQYSSFLAVNKGTRSHCEVVAATRLPNRLPTQQEHQRRQRRRHSRQPEVGRVRAVFYSS
jgi:hypothetical protein